MSHSVGIRALQQHASEVVALARAGESVEITDRGRPVARLVPVQGDRLRDLVSEGRARMATRPLTDLLHPLEAHQDLALGEHLERARDYER